MYKSNLVRFPNPNACVQLFMKYCYWPNQILVIYIHAGIFVDERIVTSIVIIIINQSWAMPNWQPEEKEIR